MHAEALNLMTRCLYRIDKPSGANVLDVGSYNVNGAFRELVETCGALYTGLDVRPGPNVDVVAEHPYNYPFGDCTFDAVICGNMLHNVPRPWLLMPELARLLRPGGLLAIVTIWKWGLNAHPVDYWRFTSEGLKILFDETENLRDYVLAMDDNGNTMGSAIKC